MARLLPPIETRFKKGVSGNPKGKVAGTLSMTKLIREYLLEIAKNGETNASKLKRAIVRRAITKSDVLAKEILDRMDGKVVQPTDLRGSLVIELSKEIAEKNNVTTNVITPDSKASSE